MVFEKVLDNYNEYGDVRILNELFPLLSGLASITVSLKPPFRNLSFEPINVAWETMGENW